jgi:very-short-patch-repair endonuclease
MNNFYSKDLRSFAHELRTESVSRAEKYIWKSLLSKNKQGVKFKRQRPIDHFIVDFFAQEIGLIVEIDGSSHFSKANYDAYRQQKLESLGFTLIRFTEGDVIQNIDAVGNQIQHVVYSLKGK